MEYMEFVKRLGIGLTGGIATGKSTVARIIMQEGYTVIDADTLSRLAVAQKSSGLAKIVEKFGANVLTDTGDLDRKKMAQIIFADHEKKLMLEQIVHPAIHELLSKKLVELGLTKQQKPWFYEASLLFETGSYKKFREVWCTHCSDQEQLRRLMQRDKISRQAAETIIRSQWSNQQKLDNAAVRINTEVNHEELKLKVRSALDTLTRALGENQ